MLKTLDLSQVIVLDIETVPQYPSFEDVPPHLQELWEQKTQFQRKPEQTANEFYERAGILAEFGKIICISLGIFSYNSKTYSLRLKSFYDEDEKKILEQFCYLLNRLFNILRRNETCNGISSIWIVTNILVIFFI